MNNKKYPAIPKILYHGQPPKWDEKGKRTEPKIFKSFDQSKKRFLRDDNYGFYFTPNKREAYDYAEGGNVYVCNVNIKNPYYFENDFHYLDRKDRFIKSANFIDKEDFDKLKRNGYDGVVLLDIMGNIGEVIALDSKQIKILKVINNYNDLIKEEYKSIIKEQFKYDSVNLNNIDNINELISLINDNILSKLVGLSNLVVNLPEERRLDLSSIKNIIEIIELIKEDIRTGNRLSEEFEDDMNFEILDSLLIKCENIVDLLYRLFDDLDSIAMNINDKFNDFKDEIKDYVK